MSTCIRMDKMDDDEGWINLWR